MTSTIWNREVSLGCPYELYHTPAERKDLAKSWRERILDKLLELSPETYCIAIPLLRIDRKSVV